MDTSEKQAATRKRPAEAEVADNDALMTPVPRPQSKKVKHTNVNEPQPLRHTGLFFHIRIDNKTLKIFKKHQLTWTMVL